MAVRNELHELIDALPESELPVARRFLRSLQDANGDSLDRFLAAAPEDDEPSTPEQDRAAAEARDAHRRGERISGEDLKREILG